MLKRKAAPKDAVFGGLCLVSMEIQKPLGQTITKKASKKIMRR